MDTVVDVDDEVAIRSGIVEILTAIMKGHPTMEQMRKARELVASAAQSLSSDWKPE